ncbi:MAG: 50S ribosomal protein L10 [Candidatus Omnitrophica bacterium]|nr:50S ribosomal protein L10 [Candidatus Omnitrophota bacterium]
MKRVGQIFREGLVNRVETGIKENDNVFLLSYSSLTSSQIGELRKDLQKIGATVFVSKNTTARLALKNAKQDQLAEGVESQTAFVWSNADSVEVSKIIVEFAKKLEQVNIRGGLLGERPLKTADVTRLSDLPSKDVLRAQLLGTLQAPISRLLGALNGKSRDLLSILKQLSEKKGGN